LWFSAIIAGFFENWSAYRQVTQSMGSSSLMQRFLGKERAERFASMVGLQMTNLISNIALAFFLIMIPAAFSHFSIHTDIRHVTISSGLVTFAALVVSEPLTHIALGALIFSCFIIGLLNVFVCFTLSFIVASRMCGMNHRDRRKVYRVIYKAFFRHPSAFIFPRHSRTLSQKKSPTQDASNQKGG
jgi:site-specific recombinase